MTSITVLTRAALIVLGVTLLAACAGRSMRPLPIDPGTTRSEREQRVSLIDTWEFKGKIAVSDGRDSGSGHVVWQQQGQDFTIQVRAPVSRQTWRLAGSPGDVTLDGLEGGPRHGVDASDLLQREVGWVMPVSDLGHWVLGLPGNGPLTLAEFDGAGLPSRIVQHGWTVEYRAWHDGEPRLPRKVFASNGDRRVRLVVESWIAPRLP
jgi:outer membrane lipoprotein LolB